MSMISSLIDELRKSADEWNGSNMFELARMCSDAADTIWQLRDDLQRANEAVRDAEHDESRAWDRVRKAEAESAKLKQEIERWHRLTAGIELPEYPITEFKPKDIERENAKLRELLAEMCTVADYLCNAITDDRDWDCDQCCPFHEGNRKKRCKLGELQVRLHELEIEVDE